MTRTLGPWALMMALAAHANAQTSPRVPPGAPTPGFTVAMISSGIDYTRADIARKLARDGEGEIIGWSTRTRDRRPFLKESVATELVANAPVLIAPVQIDPHSLQSWLDALEFLAKAPTRVVLIVAPLDDAARRGEIFARLSTLSEMLFILTAVPGDQHLRPRNVISVAALRGASAAHEQPTAITTDLLLAPAAATREAPARANAPPRTDAEAVVLAAGLFNCLDVRQARDAADVKRILIASAATGPHDHPPILAVCP